MSQRWFGISQQDDIRQLISVIACGQENELLHTSCENCLNFSQSTNVKARGMELCGKTNLLGFFFPKGVSVVGEMWNKCESVNVQQTLRL